MAYDIIPSLDWEGMLYLQNAGNSPLSMLYFQLGRRHLKVLTVTNLTGSEFSRISEAVYFLKPSARFARKTSKDHPFNRGETSKNL